MTESGTLYQLRTLINRRNITTEPSKNVDAFEDFIETLLHAHILCAAMESFGMTSINDIPQGSTLFPEGLVNMSMERRQQAILQAAQVIAESFVDINFSKPKDTKDCIHNYSCDVITLGLLLDELNDAIKDGDGDRILRCWKFFSTIV